MKNAIFKGVGSALITPFSSGKIDFSAMKKIIKMQIESGSDALIIGGTTGEASTLSFEEKQELYRFSVNEVGGRVPVILGSGSNNTAEAVRLTSMAKDVGGDAVLVVSPYYNKGTEEGIYRHFTEIASQGIPIILYNVPQRTGVNIPISTLKRLSKFDTVVGLKEASGDVERFMDIRAAIPQLPLYTGTDSQIYLSLALGGVGVISVVSNCLPSETKAIIELFDSGDIKGALLQQSKLLPMIRCLFSETSPAPLKCALSYLGLCSEEMRLPMYEVSEKTREKIVEIVKMYKELT